ncbi:MAG TPA: rRNA maturation RNase YbeY [Bacilli bacterium]
MNLKLECINEQEEQEIPAELVKRLELLLVKAGEAEEIEEGEVTLSFITDGEMRRLNQTYRGIDKTTDVLSFAMQDTTEDEMKIFYSEDNEEDRKAMDEFLGDILISIPTAMKQSEEYGHSLEREIGFLFIHGFLHLIGYDHQDEGSEKEMFAKQEQILQKAGFVR